MATELTDPDDDGVLEFTQTIEDVDGDALSVTLELDQINGTTQSGSDRDPDWLSFTTSSSLSGGTRTVDVNIEINASELGGADTTYTFVLTTDDGISTSTCRFDVDVKPPPTQYNVDGTKIITYGTEFGGEESIYDYDLTTAWDVTTVTNETKTLRKNDGVSPVISHVSPDGKYLYVGQSSSEVAWYTLSTGYDGSTATFQGTVNFDNKGGSVSNVNTLFTKLNGEKLFIFDAGTIFEYEMTTAWDLTTVSFIDSYSGVFSETSEINGAYVRSGGEEVYVAESNSNVDMGVDKYVLGSSYDFSTISHDSKHVFSEQKVSDGMYFKEDGTEFYQLTEKPVLKQFVMGTAWDITTASQGDTFDIASNIDDINPNGLFFGVQA